MNKLNDKQLAIIDLINKGVISPTTKQGLVNLVVECFSASASNETKMTSKSELINDAYKFIMTYLAGRDGAYKSKILEKMKRQNFYKSLLLEFGYSGPNSKELSESIFNAMESSGMISISGSKVSAMVKVD